MENTITNGTKSSSQSNEKKLVQKTLFFHMKNSPSAAKKLEFQKETSTTTSEDSINERKKRNSVETDGESESKKIKLDTTDCEATEEKDIDSELDISIEPVNHSIKVEEIEETCQIAECIVVEENKKEGIKKKTPKQLEKEKRREEREQMRLEKEQKRLQEKEEKEQKRQQEKEEKEQKKQHEREERQRLKELKKKELADKEEQKRKAKEEKERRKQAELERKEEERRKREEQREEERKNQNKYAKEAEVFVSFFKKQDKPQAEDECFQDHPPCLYFKTFQVKKGMRLAPINRNFLNENQRVNLEKLLSDQSPSSNYLSDLKSGKHVSGKSKNTWPLTEKDVIDDEVVVDQLELFEETSQPARSVKASIKLPRPKMLQFHENRRPPYWGTWRKKCFTVSARRPFGTYKEFDYEVDSDDEWEEEGEGESLHGSDDETEKDDEDKDGEPDDDEYEVDNDFFVPHGYLSEDEEEQEQSDERTAWSPEKQKARLKLLGEQFIEERNAKTRQLRPVVVGCIWHGNSQKFADNEVNEKISKLLSSRAAVLWDTQFPIVIPLRDIDSLADSPKSQHSLNNSLGCQSGNKKIPLPKEALPELIRLVHGSHIRRKRLVNEFQTYWSGKTGDTIFNVAIGRKIREIANWQESPEGSKKFRWVVQNDILEECGLSGLNCLENSWQFQTIDKSEGRKIISSTSESNLNTPNCPSSLITKFTKVVTAEERRQQLGKYPDEKHTVSSNESPSGQSTVNTSKLLEKLQQFRSEPPVKKRAVLFPLPPKEPEKMITSNLAAEETDHVVKKRAVLFPLPPKEPEKMITNNLAAEETDHVVKKRAVLIPLLEKGDSNSEEPLTKRRAILIPFSGKESEKIPDNNTAIVSMTEMSKTPTALSSSSTSLSLSSSSSSSSTNNDNGSKSEPILVKKRAVLISVPLNNVTSSNDNIKS